MAIVIGPTPPGTGVINLHFSKHYKSHKTNIPYIFIINVTAKMITTLVVRVIDGVHTNIDNHTTFLNHVTLDEVGNTNSSNNNISLLFKKLTRVVHFANVPSNRQCESGR